MADGVGELDFAFFSELGGHNMLGDPAAHIGGAAVHFGRVLAGEGAAAVTAGPAVAVHNDLAAGQTGVALGSANHEAAGGVDEKFGLGRDQFGRNDLLDDVLDAKFLDHGVFHISGVLGGDDDVGDGDGFAIFIDHGDLGLRIGAEPGDFAALADLGQLTSKAVREHDGRGHEFGGFIGGIAEHEALVAGTLLGGLFALGLAGVHALGDVGGLLGDDDIDEYFVGMKHVVVVYITDFPDRLAGDADEVELGLRGDFAADDDDIGLHVSLARDAAELVLGEASIQHGVGNGVGDFVRMAFAHGLRGKDVTIAHDFVCFMLTTY